MLSTLCTQRVPLSFADHQFQRYFPLSWFLRRNSFWKAKGLLTLWRLWEMLQLLNGFQLARQEWEVREALWPRFDIFYPAISKSPTDPEFFAKHFRLKMIKSGLSSSWNKFEDIKVKSMMTFIENYASGQSVTYRYQEFPGPNFF